MKHIIRQKKSIGKNDFWVDFEKKIFILQKRLFIKRRSALLAMHIAYELLLPKVPQNESVGFFMLSIRARVETKMVRRL